jgi:hypothetical protein
MGLIQKFGLGKILKISLILYKPDSADLQLFFFNIGN